MKGVISCQEETEQALLAKGREQAEEREWEEVVEEAVWTVTERVQGRAETAYALTAVRKCRIKQLALVT